MKVNVNNILNVFEKDLYNGCSNKKKIYNFEKYKMISINDIIYILKTGKYRMNKYNIFMIKYPKYRIVMSLKMKDKIINHYITKYCLIPKLTKYLDDRNIATRKNMGTDYGVKLVKKYIELNKKYNEFYVLKIDISKYFYNIDHNVLKRMLSGLDEKEYKIICNIIDSTNASYINEKINMLKERELLYTNRKKEVLEIPEYKTGKGLPIGNMTSQFLAIYYLSGLDHYIVHNLGLKYTTRYMDDYVIIHYDKKYLEKCLNIIESKLLNEYKLNINKKKSEIYNIKDGFEFLGYKFKVVNNKTIVLINNKTYCRIKKVIKYNISKYSNYNLLKFYSSINNYYNGFKYSKSLKLKRYINRLFFT